ncbi:polyprenyl synthetase family protein [Paenibacillus albiflavus]|uniref:Polyprenyl synthetase family protein n=1 Tax=Paenibacillus albiflavus TaxID=2545760 RepID=A0A4R4EB51_9BACL|nr:polyprenyl synthetase family protein [Paenibacillus albiflavus]TCZ76353.1 polyprenyl synthetase family protein [Paenibacillus albiflavus]
MNLDQMLKIDLNRIEKEIIKIIKNDPDLPKNSDVRKSLTDMVRSGGKRLRPIMVIVGSRFGKEADENKVIQLASLLEFVHVASLIHDDIIDQSDTRRSQPALHVKTGVPTAVHIGNYMMARIVELMTVYYKDRDQILNDLSTLVTTQLCLGEYQQLNNRFNYDMTIDTYLLKTSNKTALLMATCLQQGARLAKAERLVIEQLYDFGHNLGMAFQIRDDVLDFTQSAEVLGKPSGSDLINGQATLPVLYAMEDEALAGRIRSLNVNTPIAAFEEVIEEIKTSDGIDRANALSRQYMDTAWSQIDMLKSFPAARDLEQIWYYFEERIK